MSDIPQKLPALGHNPILFRPMHYRLALLQRGYNEPSTEYHNPHRGDVAPADQADHGYCVAYSSRLWYDKQHITLTGQIPTAEDRAQYKKDVKDITGCIHDVLFPQSISAMGIYVKSKEEGNSSLDEEGSDTAWAAAAMTKYGVVPESAWHTGKKGIIWTEPRETPDGGLSPTAAAALAADHRIDGYAMIGDDSGVATFDQVRAAIEKYGSVLAAIPVYNNYGSMTGGDGWFPDPPEDPEGKDPLYADKCIIGWHALDADGHVKTSFPQKPHQGIEVDQSWGGWCARHGGYSQKYFEIAAAKSVYLVPLDKFDTDIAKSIYSKLKITAKEAATGDSLIVNITIDGVSRGVSPLTVPVERGEKYTITADMVCYSQSVTEVVGDDLDKEIVVLMYPLPVPVEVKKNWLTLLIEKILAWFIR